MKKAFTMLAMALAMVSSAQEICNNGIDDDADGLIDLNDIAECNCATGTGSGPATQSIIPNPSFESFNCIPGTVSQMSCADSWVQATLGTSDYLHAGGYMPYWVPPLPSGGDACAGGYICPDYIEYIGTCLPAPMVAGTSYTLDFAMAGFAVVDDITDTVVNTFSPVEITLWGRAQCPGWPRPEWACVQNDGWVPLATIVHAPNSQWQATTMTFSPAFDVQAVMLGSSCNVPADYPSTTLVALGQQAYFLYDDLMLNETGLFPALTLTGGLCTNDALITAIPDPLATDFQWYHNGVALVGETGLTLNTVAHGAGTYQFLCVMGGDCMVEEIELEAPLLPDAEFAAAPLEGCAPLEVSFQYLGDPALTASMEWDFGDGGGMIASGGPAHTYTVAGSFDASLTVTSPEGCSTTVSYTDLITVHAAPQAAFTFGPLPTDVLSTLIAFTDASSTDVEQWTWTFGEDGALGGSIVASPSFTFPADAGGTYPVQLVVVNDHGCTDEATAEVIINDSYAVHAPNTFTPNDDAINDGWFPVLGGHDVERYRLTVFNRWGEAVWSSEKPGEGWDGRYGGAPAMDGVYAWRLDTRDLTEGSQHRYFGHVTLLR